VKSLLQRLTKEFRGPAPDSEIISAAGFQRITDSDPKDIFIVGYPKSGNTWVQNLIAGAVHGVDLELAPDSLVQDLVPDVHSKTVYKRYSSPVFFKSHALPDPQYRRVIYLLRDGRDVMVSYYHYLSALQKDSIGFLELVQMREGLFPCQWYEHVQQWLANPHRAEMLILKYEDLKKNPLQELLRICAFAGVTRSTSALERAIQKASFAAMQKREITSGWDNARWPKDKLFVRRGEIGSYRDEMPPEVQEVFLRQARGVLQQTGYTAE
jgi:Sulfotransferase domain